PRGRKRKGSRGGNCLKGWMLAVPRCSGGFSSEHFWIVGLRLRAATKGRHSAQKAGPFRRVADGGGRRGAVLNESSRSKRVKNVLSLQAARDRSNQRLLERLEAENAQLRDCVVELMLEIQALHGGAK